MKAITTILAAVDLGPATPAVLRTAETLAHETDAELHVVHAIEMDWKGTSTTDPGFREQARQAERRLAAALTRNLRVVTPASAEAVLYSRHGTVTERARQLNADLIVVGSHGHGRAALGTTLDRVLRTIHCPVWIARRRFRLPINRMVVATDMSRAGETAFESAADILNRFGRWTPRCDLVLLHVLHPTVWKSLYEPCRRELEERVAAWFQRHELEDTVRVRIVITRARATGHGILNYLRRRLPDLLIVGTHGHGMIDRLLLGSVAARVLRAVPCDALAVPPEPARKRRRTR